MMRQWVFALVSAVLLFLSPSFAPPAPAASQAQLDACSMGEGKAAIEACTRIANNRRESINTRAMVLENRGITYLKMNRLNEAIADFSKVLRWNPRAMGALFNRAKAYRLRGQCGKALKDLARMLKVLKDDPGIFEAMAECHEQLGQPDKALRLYERIISLYPDQASAFFKRAKLYLGLDSGDEKENLAKALADVEMARKLDPQNAEYACLQGLALMLKGENEQARGAYHVCIRGKKTPDLPDLTGLGLVAALSGHHAEAQKVLTRAISLSKGKVDRDVYLLRALARMRLGKFAESLDDLGKSGRENQADETGSMIRGFDLLGLGRPLEALKAFKQGLESRKTAEGYFGLGRALDALKERQMAIKALRKAAAFDHDALGGRWAVEGAKDLLARLNSAPAMAAGAGQTSPEAQAIQSGQTSAAGQIRIGGSTAGRKKQVTTVAPATAVAASQKRLALVIGNSAYRAVPALANPVNDAMAVARKLRKLGFVVIEKHDLDYEGMRKALRDFARKARLYDWAMIYYSGHGLEAGGRNYVIPVDAELKTDLDLDEEAIPLPRLISKAGSARSLGLVILDACRDNPFARKMRLSSRTRSIGRGLARIEPERGTLVIFAARDGQVAQDGDGRHSPFTRAFLEVVDEPGLEMNFLFRKLRDKVLAETSGAQEPFMYGSLPAKAFYFRPPVRQ